MTVACHNKETGKNTRGMCKVGCIACGLCVKKSDMFAVADNLATLDFGRYEPGEAAEMAMNKCPTGVIVYRGKSAPAPREAGNKAQKAG